MSTKGESSDKSSEKDQDFKVIDRRGQRDEAAKDLAGKAGFTFKDSPEEPPPAPTQIDFATLALSLATNVLMNLGVSPDPSVPAHKDLAIAKQHIEVLEMLQVKTKGNLTAEETKLLTSLLTEVRMRFIDASKQA